MINPLSQWFMNILLNQTLPDIESTCTCTCTLTIKIKFTLNFQICLQLYMSKASPVHCTLLLPRTYWRLSWASVPGDIILGEKCLGSP